MLKFLYLESFLSSADRSIKEFVIYYKYLLVCEVHMSGQRSSSGSKYL